jgi:hypothetical protein
MKQPPMNKTSEAFKQAQQLLSLDPLPDDAEQRLEALEMQIRPDERGMFGDLWSAFELIQPATEDYPNPTKSA